MKQRYNRKRNYKYMISEKSRMRDVNLNGISKKLQKAILQTGLVIKFGTRQFYSNEQKRIITIYSLTTPVYQMTKRGWKDVEYEIIKTASMIEVVNCLNDIWKAVK